MSDYGSICKLTWPWNCSTYSFCNTYSFKIFAVNTSSHHITIIKWDMLAKKLRHLQFLLFLQVRRQYFCVTAADWAFQKDHLSIKGSKGTLCNSGVLQAHYLSLFYNFTLTVATVSVSFMNFIKQNLFSPNVWMPAITIVSLDSWQFAENVELECGCVDRSGPVVIQLYTCNKYDTCFSQGVNSVSRTKTEYVISLQRSSGLLYIFWHKLLDSVNCVNSSVSLIQN